MATFVNEDTIKAICHWAVTAVNSYTLIYTEWQNLKRKVTLTIVVNADYSVTPHVQPTWHSTILQQSSISPHWTVFLCPLTFVAVPDCVEVNIKLLVGEEKQAEPGVKGINGNYEEDPNDVALLVWRAVVT